MSSRREASPPVPSSRSLTWVPAAGRQRKTMSLPVGPCDAIEAGQGTPGALKLAVERRI